MKAIKRNFRNLTKVVDSICDVPYANGLFVCTLLDKDLHSAVLVSLGRKSVGSTILSSIPSNYSFRVTFRDFDSALILSIWYE